MEPLKLGIPERVDWSYDKAADVLYMSFDHPRESLTLDLGDGLLARYEEETGEITGFTIIGISRLVQPD